MVLFDKLLRDLVNEIEEPEQVIGRPRLSLKEQVFCSIQKVYSQVSSRRAASLFDRATEGGLISHAPHFNTVSKFLNSEEATPILMRLLAISALPLKSVESCFAVDSTGFRTTSFGMYADAKYGLKRQHKWIKAHACVGTKTQVVTAIAITDETAGDCPRFADLIRTTAENGFSIQEVSADKAYCSRDNYSLVNELGGQAYIPFRSNMTGKKKRSSTWRNAFLYFQLKQDEFYQHYHRRSNIESAFAAIKKKFGDGLKSKNQRAQMSELLCKVVAYNIVVLIQEMYGLGINPQFNITLPNGA
jgi:transposase